jgi:hypothetical protein
MAARPMTGSPDQPKKMALGTVTCSPSSGAKRGAPATIVPRVVLDVPKSRPQAGMEETK